MRFFNKVKLNCKNTNVNKDYKLNFAGGQWVTSCSDSFSNYFISRLHL